jgi:DNA repair protein RadC
MIMQCLEKTIEPNTTNGNEVISAERAYSQLTELAHSEIEEFWALALSPKKTVLNRKMIFRGTVDSCLVHPRDIFRFACLENASALLIAHNHPSGDLVPSYEDIRFTQQIITAANLMEIPIIDHVIVTKTGFVSLRTDGWCQFQSETEFGPTGLNTQLSLYESSPSGN